MGTASESCLSKRLLVLAASTYQVEVIRTARALGYTVFTTDNLPSNPGHALADKAFSIDTTDYEGVRDLVVRERVDGLIAACTDVAVPTAARVGAACGLSAPSVAAAAALCSKLAFRELLAAVGLPCPEYHRLASPRDADGLLQRHPAWIIKPDRSSGSKGIAIVRSAGELAARFAEAAAFSLNGEVILEQFLEGVQGTVEGIVRDRRVQFHAVLDRQTAAPPFTATTGQRLPTRLLTHSVRRLIGLLDTLVTKLEIDHSLFDCDFVCAGDEIYLLEMTPRLGGNSIAALIRAAYPGFDLVEYAVRLACGDPVPAVPAQPARSAAVRIFGADRAGVLHYDPATIDVLRAEPWIVSLVLDVPSGAAVRPFVNGRHRLGEAVIIARDRDELDERCTELDRRLALRVA